MPNAAKERRRQKKAETPYVKKGKHAPPVDRMPASSNGVRQVLNINRLPMLARIITIDEEEGTVELTWRLKLDDLRHLKLLLLQYEACGWIVKKLAKSRAA